MDIKPTLWTWEQLKGEITHTWVRVGADRFNSPEIEINLGSNEKNADYAALIVRAVNAHDELLLAVKSSHELIQDYMNLLPRDAHDAAMFRRHLTGLKAAIAKAEGR